MRKTLLALGIFFASLCTGDAQMMQDIVNQGSITASSSCTTTEQFALNSTPNGCNLILFTQGLFP